MLSAAIGSKILGLFTNPKVILALVVAAVIGGGIWYVDHLQDTNASLEATIVQKDATITRHKEQEKQLRDDIGFIKDVNQRLLDSEYDYREQMDELSDRLSKLGYTVKARPGLVEKYVNKASDARVRCLELATGAEAKEGEKNEVCPHLID